MTDGITWEQAVAQYQAERRAKELPTEREFPVQFSASTSRYGAAALERRCAEVAAAGEGTRNDTLNGAYYSISRLIAGGEVSEADARSALRSAGLASGLAPAEVEKVLRQDQTSAFRAAQENPKAAPPRNLTVVPPTTELDEEPQFDPATGELLEPAERERTSWWPVDIDRVLSGDLEPDLVPEFLARQDGHRLIYSGKVNGLIGASESGKSWVALLAVKQAVETGQRVSYLDFEDAAQGVVGRLLKLGVDPEAVREFFRYVRPEDAFDNSGRLDLGEHLGEFRPVLVVVDGLNAAMDLLGFDMMSNPETTRFFHQFLRPLAATGAAVIYVDHIVKSSENRTPGGIGAQAKRALTDGATLRVSSAEPFAPGMVGRIELVVDKDRHAAVRAVSALGMAAGTAVLDSTGAELTLVIEGPVLNPTQFNPNRPTLAMERISRLLEDSGMNGASQTGIEKAVAGRTEDKREALAALVEQGFVSRHRGGRGGGFLYRAVRAFRENGDTPEFGLTSSEQSQTDPGAGFVVVTPATGGSREHGN